MEESLEDGEKVVNVSRRAAHSFHELRSNIHSLDVKILAIKVDYLSIVVQKSGAQLDVGMFLVVAADPLASIGLCFPG